MSVSAQRASGGSSSRATSRDDASEPEVSRADARFPRSVRATFKAIRAVATETALLRIPWGPRLSVLFLPRDAQSISGGRLRVYAVVESFEVKVADVPIPNGTDPVQVLVEAGCDAFLVRASLGSPLPAGVDQPESYVYASTYAGAL